MRVGARVTTDRRAHVDAEVGVVGEDAVDAGAMISCELAQPVAEVGARACRGGSAGSRNRFSGRSVQRVDCESGRVRAVDEVGASRCASPRGIPFAATARLVRRSCRRPARRGREPGSSLTSAVVRRRRAAVRATRSAGRAGRLDEVDELAADAAAADLVEHASARTPP